MNGYDAHSTVFARPGRPTVAEASKGGDKRSDGEASQTRDGANRYDTSTPERRKKALAAARRSGNPADEEKVRKQINSEASSTNAIAIGVLAHRDNRVKKRGGYRSPIAVHEGESQRGRVAESALNPQIRFRDTVDNDGFQEAELDAKKRNKLSKDQFALPGERYPIPDEAHARNALARVVQHGSPEEIAKVRAAVKRKFPGIDVSGGKSSDKKKAKS